jgi:hypothetical protein
VIFRGFVSFWMALSRGGGITTVIPFRGSVKLLRKVAALLFCRVRLRSNEAFGSAAPNKKARRNAGPFFTCLQRRREMNP